MGLTQDPSESFSSRMFAAVRGREKWELGDDDDFQRHVLSILDPTQDPVTGWNGLTFCLFSPTFMLGTTPFCWWSIDSEIIRRILFQEVLVVTLFNPAFLVAKLEAAGFEVKRTGRRNEFTASKACQEGKLELPEWRYFIRLITDHFMSEDGVVQIVKSAESRMVQDKVKPRTRVNIALEYHQ